MTLSLAATLSLALAARAATATALPATAISGAVLHGLEHDQDQATPVTAARLADGAVLGIACGRRGAQVQCAAYTDGLRTASTVRIRRAAEGALDFEVGALTLRAPVPAHHDSLRSLTRAFGPALADAAGVALDGSLLPARVDPGLLAGLAGG